MNATPTSEAPAKVDLAFTNRAAYRAARRPAAARVRRLTRALRRVDSQIADALVAGAAQRVRRATIIRGLNAAEANVARIDAAPRGHAIPGEVTA